MTRLAVAAALLACAVPSAVAAPGPHVRVLRLVDRSRVAHTLDGRTRPRVLVTTVRVPAHGRPPYPLVLFAHGFALTPAVYSRLLDTWAGAGFVVAAPAFPVEKANAPGGASESDLANEPGDLSFVLTQLTSRSSPFAGLIDPAHVAVAGQSDGGVAALSVAYDRRYADRRIDAALVMSGSPLPGYTGPARALPLLAVQGTADPLNPPATTSAYFAGMHRPKFLLWLLGAPHLPPYTTTDRWAGVVDRTTTAFLDRYLRGGPPGRVVRSGTASGIARIVSSP